jgi:hypothetical protein
MAAQGAAYHLVVSAAMSVRGANQARHAAQRFAFGRYLLQVANFIYRSIIYVD